MAETLTHPDIRSAVQTCEAVPDQWQGTLTEGRFFYLRYRHGWVSLAVGFTPQSVEGFITRDRGVIREDAASVAAEYIGGPLDGMFDSEADRDAAFARLYRRIQEADDE